MTFSAAPHHEILLLLVHISILLATARLLGALMQSLGQPTVVGEILAGVVLGPSFLSGLSPELGEWIVPQTAISGYLLELVGLMGVILLLLLTGLETDLVLMRRQARSALGVATGGLVFPLVMGFGLGLLLPERLLVDNHNRYVFALFVATAMSISAIPVLAKVLMDLNLTRRDIAQVTIAAAMVDDSTGWILLSIVIGLAGGAPLSLGGVAQAVGSVLAVILLSATVGYWLVKQGLHLVQTRLQGREKTLSFVLFCTFTWSALSHWLEVEALLGAFLMGLIFSQMRQLESEVVHKIESITLGFFAPIFFAIAGLKVNLISILESVILIETTLVVIAVASFCKIVGVYLGARYLAKYDHWTALFFGMGLNARGSMEIIVATVGLSLGILTQDMFSIIVVMAVFTSLIAPSGMRYAIQHIPMSEEEKDRLKREDLNRVNVLANLHKILIPIRARAAENGGLNAVQTIQLRLLERLDQNQSLAFTLMSVQAPSTPKGDKAETAKIQTGALGGLAPLLPYKRTSRKTAFSHDPASSILDEAKRAYDLIMLGASEEHEGGSLFTPVIDSLVRLAPCPTIIVHSLQRRLPDDWRAKRILVPVTGSTAGRNAAYLAFRLAAHSENCEVLIMNAVQASSRHGVKGSSPKADDRQLHIGREIVEEMCNLGRIYGAKTRSQVEVGQEPELAIIQTAKRERVDLIILGTNVRPASEQLYLGPKVERILNNAPAPVVIINAG
jgi:Kef-type K+ transport system membrane component KefB/nucleotide-binding universal stress UspA family protein